MKKALIVIKLVALAIIIDGAMTYDIFENRPENYLTWAVMVLVAILALIIHLVDSSPKKDPNQREEP